MTERVVETVRLFCEGWKKGSTRKMYKYCQKTWKKDNKRKKLSFFKENPLQSYSIHKVSRKTNVVYDVYLDINLNGNNERIRVRLLCEEKPFKPSVHGEFGVNPFSIK